MRRRLKKNKYIYSLFLKLKYFYHDYIVNDRKYIEKEYINKTGRQLNLENPTLYNEKLQWLKLYWHDDSVKQCVDKYIVRDFVSKRIGSKYLNEIYGVYSNVEDIDFEEVPQSFVIKATHSSGHNIIVKDKSTICKDKIRNEIRQWLEIDYYYFGKEWVYKDLEPKIIIEKYMEDESGELRDYKIFCFHGEPRIIQVDVGRFSEHKRNIYNLNWELLDVSIQHPNEKNTIIPKPLELDKMLELSKKLSRDFPHVRVDFYLVEGKIIFGELTFFHGSGHEKIEPIEFEEYLGNQIKLDNIMSK